MGPEEPLFESQLEKNIEDSSADRKYLLFNTRVPGEPIEIWELPLFGDRKPFRVVSAAASCEQGRFSPDGKWIAYRSINPAGAVIYVQGFLPAGGKWQISNAGGMDPPWRRDGMEIFYVAGNKLMAVAINRRVAPLRSRPSHRALFEVGLWRSGQND